MKKIIPLIIVLGIVVSVVAVAFALPSSGNVMLISKDKIAYDISDTLYGVSIEDIGYACDGGLASNLVNNNSFEYEGNKLFAWDIDFASYSVQYEDGLNENNRNYLSVTVDGEGVIFNKGYTEIYNYKTYNVNEKKKDTADMGFKKGERYQFSAYFKNIDFIGNITVSLEAKGNSQTHQFSIEDFDDWTKVIFPISSDVTADGGLMITANGTGSFNMDFVSLVPEDSHGFYSDVWKYTSVRSDLYDALKELSPSFIRFPGETAEFESTDNIVIWKDTIGPLEERVQTPNLCRDDSAGNSYNNSNEMGYYEYFLLCEDLGAIPIPIVNAGISCQDINEYDQTRENYRNGALTEEEWQAYLDKIALRPETVEWEEYVQNVLDLIEYANGSTYTYWGSIRAQNGHKEPFNIQYLEIGNEARGEVYWRNFNALYQIIKEKYPEITLIVPSGEGLQNDYTDLTWNNISSNGYDVMVDEHYSTGDGALFNELNRYDKYERTGAQVIIGECAVISNGYGTVQTKNNIWSAIEEASYLTSIEKNADIVKMIAYAPVFAKLNAQSKDTSLVWFDSQETCLTPDYYVQMLFANNCGNRYIATDLNLQKDGIFQSVTVDTDEKVIYVKIVNSNTRSESITLDFEGFDNITTASNQYLSEVFKCACNELGDSIHVAPKEKSYQIKNNKLKIDAEGLSVNVIRIPYGDNDGSELYTLPETGIVTPYIHIAIKIAIPCVIGVLLVITGFTVLVNSHIWRKKENSPNTKKNNN